MKQFLYGAKDGIPIALGYISVSFTFGLMTIESGLPWWQAVLISMCNLTSAGQFAGLGIIVAGGGLIEMAISQFVINLRYALMAISLSQNVNERVSGINRWIFGFGITDEVFAVSVSKTYKVGRCYLTGIMLVSYLGWVGGTILGALLGGVLPQSVSAALGLAIYGMFVALVIPPARNNKNIAKVVAVAVTVSCIFKWVPGLNNISSGFAIIISSVVAASVGACLLPLDHEGEE